MKLLNLRARSRFMLCLLSLALGGCQRVGPSTFSPSNAPSLETRQQAELAGEILPEENAAEAEASALAPPRIQGDRLWRQLASLVGQRYWVKERAAIRQQITESLVASGWNVEEQAFDQGVNLVATYPSGLEGRKEPQKILVGAHYDTVQGSPGADDNATGMAVLLEIAALYNEQRKAEEIASTPADHRPGANQRGLMLVFFDQEEQGLLGSLAFTAEPGNLESMHSAIVLDMLGASCAEPGCQAYPEFLDRIVEGQYLSDRGDFIAVVGEVERPGLLGAFGRDQAAGDPLFRRLPPVLRVPVPFKGLLTPDVLRSDHAAFWLNGVGAVLITDTANLRNPHYHQPSDDLSQVDRAFFEGVAQQVVNGVWQLLAKSGA